MFISLITLVCLAIFLGYINPLSHWGSYWCVFRATCKDTQLPKRAKMRLLKYMLSDLVLSPLHCTLWLVDELIFSRQLNNVSLKDPVFIVSQPRSGSTFLHRLLADDEGVFFAVTYLEWRWPYICVWYVLDRLRLRDWINGWNYWPSNNAAGRIASQMHPHLYGDYEEHGVFLEEKFYHHYFVFRRFPFTQLLDTVAHFDTLTFKDQRRLLDVFERVIRKVAYYRGEDRIWITKENESVSFYYALFTMFPKSTYLFLMRDYKDMLASYIKLSCTSTFAKTGTSLQGCAQKRHEANIGFRRRECAKFVEFYKYFALPYTVLLNYGDLTSNLFVTTIRLYKYLSIDMSEDRARCLLDLSDTQRTRTRDYEVSNLSSKDIEGFDEFADLVKWSQQNGIRFNQQKGE